MKFFSSCFLLFLACVLCCECRRTNGPQPQGPDTTVKVSDSKFASMSIVCDRFIGRDTLGHTGANLTCWANFYDSSGNAYDDEFRGHIYFDNVDMPLSGPQVPGTPSWYAYLNGASTASTDMVDWKVISANGVTDLQFTEAAATINLDTLPYKIYCSAGLSLPVKKSWFPGMDSVYIEIYNESKIIDTIVSLQAGTIVLPPSAFSNFITQANHNLGYIYMDASEKHAITVNGMNIAVQTIGAMQYSLKYYP